MPSLSSSTNQRSQVSEFTWDIASQRRTDIVVLAILMVVVAAVWVSGDPFLITLAVGTGINAVACLGLGPALRLGDVKLSQAAIMAVGAYVVGMLSVRDVPAIAALVLGIGLGCLSGYVLAAIIGRLAGYYLAMGTLAFALVVFHFILNTPYFKGSSGISGIPQLGFGSAVLPNRYFLWFVWILVLLLAMLVRGYYSGASKRVLHLLGISKTMSAALGIDTGEMRRTAFAFAGAFAGLAGALHAYYFQFVNPTPFSVIAGVYLVLMVVIGGTNAVYGPVIGAVLITALGEVVEVLAQLTLGVSHVGEWRTLLLGAVLILVIIRMRGGVGEFIEDTVQQFRGGRTPPGSEPTSIAAVQE